MVCGVVGTVTILLLVSSKLDCSAKSNVILRSFDEMVLECAELMSITPLKLTALRSGVLVKDTETKCLLRCVGVSGRFWNDYTGLRKDILARYFLADAADAQNVNRTQICLNDLPALPQDSLRCCNLALESFLCFFYNYGNLRQDRIFVPLDQLQLQHVMASCMDVHQITTEHLMSQGEEEMDANDNVHCLVRCIGIKTGTYSDRDGVNMDLVYAQYGEGYCEADFKTKAYECIRQQSVRNYGDPCKRAYHLLYKCFENVRNVITEYEIRDSGEV
ncbi:general odorant-binding protein 45-like [Anopheles marshallii]|uniref:general odorant-binding protein 45-like n=1 Tax=Anopheles marshallii TaxID=1521116 RepID=UPI00237BD69B|nr:general odorant-binding protein 45-like [Anopheles marshallii]